MPLLVNKDRPRNGDLFVAYYLDYEEEAQDALGMLAGKSSYTPVCDIMLCEYQKEVKISGSTAAILGFNGGIICRELVSVLITPSSYGGWGIAGDDRYLGQTTLASEDILGFVCGSLDTSDSHACLDFVRQVIRKYHAILRTAMREAYSEICPDDTLEL